MSEQPLSNLRPKAILKILRHEKKHVNFFYIKVFQLLCVICILILTFSYAPIGLRDPNTGFIIDVNSAENTKNGVIYINGDYRSVVAVTTGQMICLAFSRMSAFSMYPLLVLVFLSKCKATINFILSSPLGRFREKNMHALHTYAGGYIAYDALIHALFHLIRWAAQGNISLLWKTVTGLSGLIVVLFTPIITFLMYKTFKKSIRYEVRKRLHYLFYVFAIGMCFHVPTSGIPNGGFIAPVMGFVICLYTLDSLYVLFFMTEEIETTTFHVLECGVLVNMAVTDSFRTRIPRGGFAYVCLPWIDEYQWHAFSLFENPVKPNDKQVFMLKTGDWTTAVHKALQRDTRRPIWVRGPFLSEYNDVVKYDNQILVATGIGITPALATIGGLKDTRRISFIWILREPEMLEFFLTHLDVVQSGWILIYYTGKAPLNPILEELNTNVKIIKGRPNFKTLIPNLIYGIESKDALPEKYIPNKKEEVYRTLVEEMDALEQTDLSQDKKIRRVYSVAMENGFQLAALMDEIGGDYEDGSDTDDNDGPTSECMSCATDSQKKLSTGNGLYDNDETKTCEMAPVVSVDNSDFNASKAVKFKHPKKGRYYRLVRQEKFSKQLRGVSMRRRSIVSLPWDEKDQRPNASTQEYVKKLSEHVLSTWGILYCGGSQIVEKNLKDISKEYGIEFGSESFAW